MLLGQTSSGARFSERVVDALDAIDGIAPGRIQG
jgi:hypothetical protein